MKTKNIVFKTIQAILSSDPYNLHNSHFKTYF